MKRTLKRFRSFGMAFLGSKDRGNLLHLRFGLAYKLDRFWILTKYRKVSVIACNLKTQFVVVISSDLWKCCLGKRNLSDQIKLGYSIEMKRTLAMSAFWDHVFRVKRSRQSSSFTPWPCINSTLHVSEFSWPLNWKSFTSTPSKMIVSLMIISQTQMKSRLTMRCRLATIGNVYFMKRYTLVYI